MSFLSGDNPFYKKPDPVVEGVVANSVRSKLNELQEYWNQNAERFLSGSYPLFPIMGRPFSVAKKNGLLVVGENHPMPSWAKKQAEMFVLARKNNQLPVHDKDGWHIHWGTNDKDEFVQKDRQKLNNEKNLLDRYLNSENSVMEFRDPSDKYYKNFIKTLKALKREDLFDKVHFAELVPFASTDIKSIPEDVYEKSFPWLESFILLCKPKVIISSKAVGEKIKSKFGGKIIRDHEKLLAGANKSLMTIYELSGTAQGTILISVQHFSNSTGVSYSRDYDDDAMRDSLNRAWQSASPKRKVDGPLLSPEQVNQIVKDNLRKIDRDDLEDFRTELEQISKKQGQSEVDKIISAYAI